MKSGKIDVLTSSKKFDTTRNNREASLKLDKMRKYYQLALALIAIISLVSLLFYRHEYNKLHYVLEVFNYFGQPCTKVLPNCTNAQSPKPPHDLSEPLPSWLKFNDNLFLYSSYNIENKQIRTIAFGEIPKGLACAVYLDDNHEAPVFGQVSHFAIPNTQIANKEGNPELQGHYLNCDFKERPTPIGVKYFEEYRGIQDTPIMAVKSSPENVQGEDSAMCVLPTENPLKVEDKLSFLSLHNILGFRYFAIYDFGLGSQFNSEVKRNVNSNFHYETLPWNFPFLKLDANGLKNLIQADCFLRTRNVAKFAVTLSWKEYIVLSNREAFATLEDLLVNFHRNRLFGNCYSIKTVAFCAQQPNDPKADRSAAIIFRLTQSYPKIYLPSVDVCKPHEVLNNQKIKKLAASLNLVKIHSYDVCHGIEDADLQSGAQDDVLLGFQNSVDNSSILKNN